jgi:hypothetical protein
MKEEGSTAPRQRPPRQIFLSLNDWSAGDEAIDDHDYRDYQQKVDQPATHVHDEEAEHPQDEQNYRNSPKHGGILVRRSELHRATWQRACLSF